MSEKYRRAATTYYKTTSGIGKAILAHEGRPIKVGVIGLGAGTLATYGDADDTYRFYDINPAVPRIAREQFTYLGDSPAKIEIVAGRRAPQPRARAARRASTCSPWTPSPATRSRCTSSRVEAVGAYLRHMKPAGRHRLPRLQPLPRPEAGAARHRREARPGVRLRPRDERRRRHHQRLGAAHALQAASSCARRSSTATEPVAPQPDWRLWTDAYNNILQVWRR